MVCLSIYRLRTGIENLDSSTGQRPSNFRPSIDRNVLFLCSNDLSSFIAYTALGSAMFVSLPGPLPHTHHTSARSPRNILISECTSRKTAHSPYFSSERVLNSSAYSQCPHSTSAHHPPSGHKTPSRLQIYLLQPPIRFRNLLSTHVPRKFG